MKNFKASKILTFSLILTFLVALTASAYAFFPFVAKVGKNSSGYNLSSSRLFPMTLSYVQNNYVDPARIDPKEMLKGGMNELQKVVPEILVTFNSPNTLTVTINNASKHFSSSLSNLDDLWKMTRDIFAFIEMNYHGEVKLEDIESTVINGSLNMLDPHSAFMMPDYYKEFKIDTGGNFGGLGVVITSKDGQLTVISPIEGTPAWRAGLKSGDIISQIGDESTINMPLTRAVERMRGKVGSKVQLTIERKGKSAAFNVTLTRENIHIDSIKSSAITDTEGTVGYIKVKRFQKDTAPDFQTALQKIKAESAGKFKGLIMDLRDDPGGLLDQAIDVADIFLSDGVIVSTVGAKDRFIDEDSARGPGTEGKYPLIVLVNQGSASASEIVAGALQAFDRALLIGEKTFGKGSVQSVYELGDNYALKLTVAQYLTAGKYSIQTTGIIPDITTFPITVDKKKLNLLPNKTASEVELEKHLNQVIPSTGRNTRLIGYYAPYVDENDIEAARKKEYEEPLDFKSDFDVKLATKIILSSSDPAPSAMLAKEEAIIKGMEKQEDEKISTRLSEIGTAWDSGTAGKNPSVSATFGIKQNGQTVERAAAGEKVDLVMSLTNNNKTPLYRMIGVIDSKDFLIEEKEFVFGKVAPGQTVTKDLTIELPASLTTKNIPFTVDLQENALPINKKYNFTLKVREVKKPVFSFLYQLDRPKTVAQTTPLPKDKSVPLIVKVKNIGAGATSKNTSVYIATKDQDPNIFIEKGRIELGVIKPGEVKEAKFLFRVKSSIKESQFQFDLIIQDRDLIEFADANLKFTIGSGAVVPAEGIWYEGPKIDLTSEVPLSTSDSKANVKGNITDNQVVKDYYIFVNEEKAVYKANPEETARMGFDNTLKLKDGNNTITILARDNNDLTTRKSVVIDKGVQ